MTSAKKEEAEVTEALRDNGVGWCILRYKVKESRAQLQNYRNWWSKSKYRIERVELYAVDGRTGSYKLAASGTLEQVAAFLSKG